MPRAIPKISIDDLQLQCLECGNKLFTGARHVPHVERIAKTLCGSCCEEGKLGLPTEDEIAAATALVRQDWNEREHRVRAGEETKKFRLTPVKDHYTGK